VTEPETASGPCTVADDFLPTLQGLLDRADPPDHIIIETSGLALPKPLVKAFDWPDIRARLTVDGVIAVVDAAADLASKAQEGAVKTVTACLKDHGLVKLGVERSRLTGADGNVEFFREIVEDLLRHVVGPVEDVKLLLSAAAGEHEQRRADGQEKKSGWFH